MRIKIDKECILIEARPGFNILYLWWGLDPWWECTWPNIKTRTIEFGIGPWSWEIMKFK